MRDARTLFADHASAVERLRTLPEQNEALRMSRQHLAFVCLVAVFALTLSHLAAFIIGGWMHRTPPFESVRPAALACPAQVDVLKGANCIELARTCYARKRLERVKGQG